MAYTRWISTYTGNLIKQANTYTLIWLDRLELGQALFEIALKLDRFLSFQHMNAS